MEITYKRDIENLEIQYKSSNIVRAENKRSVPYSKTGWKKFYPIDENKFVKNYGQTVETKLMLINNNEIYTGTVNIQNKKHGYGISTLKNGTKYTGYWEENHFEGWGETIDSDGNIFHGLFIQGTLNGKGEKFSINGNYYEGEFMDGLRCGQGHEETKEHVYDGNYDNDKKNRKGKLVYKNLKDSYEGEFLDNNITGKGEYKWANGDKFVGDFINGKMDGKGFYKWPDGGEYEGSYVNNIKEGTGKFKWSNGKVFEGPFDEGKIFILFIN